MTPFLRAYRRTPAQRAMDRKLLKTYAQGGRADLKLPALSDKACRICGFDRRLDARTCAFCGA